MAGALVPMVIEQLASTTCKQIQGEVNVDGEVKNLIIHFNAIQAVLQDAEERQVKEESVRNWLQNLEDVSYDINDVLDEWNTEILKHQIEKEEEGENVALKKRKVSLSIPFISVIFGSTGNVIMRHNIAKRIKEINVRLTEIATLRENYNFHENTIRATEKLERVETSSFVQVSSIIGREEEKKRLVSMLLSESSQQGRSPFVVIPIVGMGGLGKTAFAQLVYNDDEIIKTHFDTRIWVCVSDPFEEIKIARAIAQALNKDDNRINSTSLQPLLECINEYISGKKFFLVLDDVWTPTIDNWEPLMRALQNSAIGSRILLTTRKDTVATVTGAAADHVICLNILSDQDCLQLFNKIAFFNRERNDQLEEIGRKIVKKCNGLPLAAKTLASLMRCKKTRKEWVDVLDNKIWELKEVEQQVFRSLFLSYYELSPAVRRCLLFCAIFPKDYEFDRDELIECWMSQEYLSMKGDREKERMRGQQYFDNLVMRSFFQDFVKNVNDDDIIRCKMHDIVHDFVQFLTKNECFIMEVVESGKEKNMVVDNKVRHLNLMSTYNDSFPVSIYNNCKGLRTLVISTSKLLPLPSDSFSKLKSIRTLKFNKNSIKEVPESIGGLVHLRYLDLSFNRELKELPDSVGNLFNLETLRLMYCQGLREVPVSLRKLVNLKHLYIEGCERLKLPKEIGRLRNLQILDCLYLQDGGEDDDGIFKLGDLGNLEQLSGSLCIENLNSAKDGSEAKNAELVNKKNLLHLTLDFGLLSDPERAKDEEILNGFQVHTNLESLDIWNYHSTTLCPSWVMSCHNLRRLEFYDVPFCGVLAPLGKLPSLEYLEINRMESVKKVGVEFLGITGETPQTLINSFPKLKELRFHFMEEWEEWEGVEEEDSKITIMPSLLKLEIVYCERLKALPNFLWKTPLRELIIFGGDCPILAQWFETRCGMEWLKNASQVQNIKIQGKFVKKDGVGMLEED
ncbi:PREDICTED: putative disease resistance protein RGA3 [Prunus mume]|uniref:Disease resistance protein RGA3 n=1 Tax=Prunus mume TaxID=102107 RepID=A0ABM0N4G5_PRUMU|nr:PREDICTED: putative disease resistance protein RGA3 [Prunus mume]XP_008219400.1 PREDICTED: putative disease resistance protein RGA3 [Prunus mume]XP_008219401.1 PREDICTED: putative disease resistance protein RGA3 [Prunus mume]XP_008219402.1 PREDICTED: putative disease resistance protein RGA3 [Prunus mume]XP_016647889.1 PREDICTED: putative disease resistance protein RGA3 [Prunus mume]XP_016647890.1 PREDICTED: putative disease resistance protein RGA3 [Prunus mume]